MKVLFLILLTAMGCAASQPNPQLNIPIAIRNAPSLFSNSSGQVAYVDFYPSLDTLDYYELAILNYPSNTLVWTEDIGKPTAIGTRVHHFVARLQTLPNGVYTATVASVHGATKNPSTASAPFTVSAQSTGSPAIPTQAALYILPSGSTIGSEASVAGPFLQPITTTSTTCNKPSSSLPEATDNPAVWRVNDPYHTGMICEFPFPVTTLTGPAFRTVSTYIGDCGGTLCESSRSPINSTPFRLGSISTAPNAPPFVSLKATPAP